MAESGPTMATSSGFGGLWFDGMVGMRDPVGEGNSPPGEGKRGVMSGDNSVYGGESGGPGNTAGAAEIEEALEGVSKFSSEVEEREDVAMKATVSGKRNQNEAIQIMRRIKAHYTSWGQQLMCNDMV